jgi:hypothetical protein
MLTPEIAAIILLVVSAILLIVIPMLDGSEKFSKFISLRYTLVAVALIMALGCILDFSHLTESSRNIVLMGGLILVGIFVVVRSLEKLKLGNKTIEISAERNGVKVGATIKGKDSKDSKKNEIKDTKQETKEESVDLSNIEDERGGEE